MTALLKPRRAAVAVISTVALAATLPASAGADASLNGQDPYASGCATDAEVAGTGTITDDLGQTFGQVDLMWSPSCGTNWGVAYFDDGNTPSDPQVTVTVSGTDPSMSEWSYNNPQSFSTAEPGSPVWGNMAYSPGCAKARVTFGAASGLAVQDGCPPDAG